MKTLSVLVSFALLAGANGLSARMRRTGSLPAQSHATAHAQTNNATTFAKVSALNVSANRY
jgi:hypothetical protein